MNPNPIGAALIAIADDVAPAQRGPLARFGEIRVRGGVTTYIIGGICSPDRREVSAAEWEAWCREPGPPLYIVKLELDGLDRRVTGDGGAGGGGA
jgi:hypothetical protein